MKNVLLSGYNILLKNSEKQKEKKPAANSREIAVSRPVSGIIDDIILRSAEETLKFFK